jgi:hypothetical protein
MKTAHRQQIFLIAITLPFCAITDSSLIVRKIYIRIALIYPCKKQLQGKTADSFNKIQPINLIKIATVLEITLLMLTFFAVCGFANYIMSYF